MNQQRLLFTTSFNHEDFPSQATFLAVGTPPLPNGEADLSYLLKAAADVAEKITADHYLVIKSTVPVGTGKKVEAQVKSILQKRNVPFKIFIVSNPEFLREGKAVSDFMNPDRIVIGSNTNLCEDLFREIYSQFIKNSPEKLLFVKRESSELIKYVSNTMLATRISFMNEIAQLWSTTL